MSEKVIRTSDCEDCPHSFYVQQWQSTICSRLGIAIVPLCPESGVREDCPLEDAQEVQG